MKVSKTARSTGRRLFRLCMADGRMDEAKLREIIQKLASEKPRDYRGILQVIRRNVKSELERKAVSVTSAAQLDPSTAEQLSHTLRQKYGQDLNFHFQTDPDLIGGLRIRVGDDVFDGSVKSRLQRLANVF